MSWFKSYDDEYRELLSLLVDNWEMKEHYAQAFMDTYKRNIGRMVASGEEMAKQLRSQDSGLQQTILALDFEDPNLVVVCQAYLAYMNDLRKGKFVGSMVEKAIWAILANRSDLLGHLDAYFAEYIFDEHEKKFPELLEEVFADEQEFRKLKLENSSSVENSEDLSRDPMHDQEESEQVGCLPLLKGEPDLKFLSELPHPDHSRIVKAYQYHQFSIMCYRDPKSFGEIVAGIPTIYKYPHVAVIEEHNEPKLMIRTEESFDGTIFICSLSSNGRGHRNFGVFPHDDTASFLQRVVEEVSRLDTSKENRPRDGAADRVIINCPSCSSALRVPRGKSGKVRCKACGELFKTRT